MDAYFSLRSCFSTWILRRQGRPAAGYPKWEIEAEKDCGLFAMQVIVAFFISSFLVL